ncbi:MAG: hypothetical protein KDJ38_17440 [Gammaproteobacteria bacterium]|nr:hypothetical protein [Gammaproteobacteria bacterium]
MSSPASDDRYQALKCEYDEFTYTISHDFSAPLRHIKQFSMLLLESLDNEISEEGRLFSEHIRRSVDRAQGMLDGLLELSRTTTNISEFTRFEVSDLVESLGHEFLTDAIEWQIKNLPWIYGDRKLLAMLFRNVIENAIKFQRKNHPLHICISGETAQENTCLFEIQDNGIGIVSDNPDSVFTPFFRLNADDEYAGLGMGLTICRKIVALHGGKIWCKGQQDQGSTVSFVLPLGQPSH